ncbi:MAG: universal stress protein [Bacteroidales bacterium]
MESTQQNVILVATDFTPLGDYAIDHAANMAKLINHKLVLLHVINSATKKKWLKGKKNQDPVADRLSDIAKKVKQEHGIEVEYLAPEGSIFSTIAESARHVGARFLFMGTHGKKGIQFLLGSFALKVVTTSPVPIVVVQKPSLGINYKSIVYPLDLDIGSKQKVKWAIFMHKNFGSVIDILVYNINDDATQRKLRADLKQVENILEQNNVSYTSSVADARGSFDKQIVAYAKQKNADAIMISTDPDTLSWNPFGTQPERILYNEEKIPVMCINSRDLRLIIGGP